MRFAIGRRWRIHVEANLWPLPRPYLTSGWEGRTMWLGLVFGNHHTDDPFSFVVHRDLSQFEFDLLVRALVRAPERS
ncbi:MAG: hypothetical protein JSS68_01885 [Actinobacteria bacterium]|nr:hypothetical protein [Actinomycetota bacterium]